MMTTARVTRVSTRTAATVAILMACIPGANALAARDNIEKCDDSSRNGWNLIVSTDALSIKVVEHMAMVPGNDITQSLDQVNIDLQVEAPVLSLSPRVATMLDKIFEIDKAPAESESTSPVADELTNKAAVKDPRDVTVDAEVQLPGIQQRMLRRDI